jgi:anaerobic selenocysteine-containing dehydrogenase
VQRQCPLCEAHCGIRVEIDAREQVLRIDGDPDDVLSHGYICPKATTLKTLHEDPQRLRTPMRRVGEEFEPISWETAYANIGQRVRDLRRKHGKDSVGIYQGNPTAHSTAVLALEMLKKVLGSRNIYSASSVDQFPQYVSSLLMFGDHTLLPVADIDRTDYLLVIGANPAVSNGSLSTMPDARGRLKAVRERGGKVVVLDPRRTETARLASEHVSIRPGGDPYLLLAMLNVIFAEGLDRVPSWVDGLDEVKQVAAQHPPQSAAAGCGIDAETITRLAREFAGAGSAVAYGRLGVCHHTTGSVTHWLINVLNAVTGNLDHPGGSMFPSPPVDLGRLLRTLWGPSSYDEYRSRGAGLPELVGELSVAAMPDEITRPGPRQLRGLIVVAGNPTVSGPDATKVREAMDELELLVCLDFYLSETARHADFVLPPVSHLERSELDLVFPAFSVRNNVRYSPRAFRPPQDAQEDWDILQSLTAEVPRSAVVRRVLRAAGRVKADRIASVLIFLGPRGRLRHPLRGLSAARVRRTPGGLDLGPLESRLPGILRTPERRVRLAPGELLAAVAELSAPAVGTGYDLQLIGRRHLRSNNSWLNRVPAMSKGSRRCTVLMHPDDAATRGLQDGQQVTVRSSVGVVELPAELTDEIRAGVVSIPHGWGGPDGGVNTNLLTDGALVDSLSGNAALNATWVAVEPVSAVAPERARAGVAS